MGNQKKKINWVSFSKMSLGLVADLAGARTPEIRGNESRICQAGSLYMLLKACIWLIKFSVLSWLINTYTALVFVQATKQITGSYDRFQNSSFRTNWDVREIISLYFIVHVSCKRFFFSIQHFVSKEPPVPAHYISQTRCATYCWGIENLHLNKSFPVSWSS